MLQTSVAGLDLSCCILNASGPKCGHISDLENIAKSRAGGIVSKSATLKSQSGNPLPRLRRLPNEGSINSEGLPNSGIDYYTNIQKVCEPLSKYNKPYIVSLSGLSLDDNLQMLKRVLENI